MDSSRSAMNIKILNDLFFGINQLEVSYYPCPVYNASVKGVGEFLALLEKDFPKLSNKKENALSAWIVKYPVDKATNLTELKQHKANLLTAAVDFIDSNSTNPFILPEIAPNQELLNSISSAKPPAKTTTPVKTSATNPYQSWCGPKTNIFNLDDYQKSGSLPGFMTHCSNTTVYFSQAVYSQFAICSVMGVLTMYNNFYVWYYANVQPLFALLTTRFNEILTDTTAMPPAAYEAITDVQGFFDEISKYDPNNLGGNFVPFPFPGYTQWNNIVSTFQSTVSTVPSRFTTAMNTINKYCPVTAPNSESNQEDNQKGSDPHEK